MSEAKQKDTRFRGWATVVYPESAPENWQQLLSDLIVPCFVSPLHDKDINPTGEPKKPHYHVLFNFESKKSREQMAELIQSVCGVGLEHVQTIRGYARYLCHLDNPEKAQYEPKDVLAFGGLDYTLTIGLPYDRYKVIGEMMKWCWDNHVVSFAHLLNYALDNEQSWFQVLCDNGTVVMKEYLKSCTWRGQEN